MKNIGIVCEGPTDYVILKAIVDHIFQEDHYYVQLQPEPDLTGEYGNGWKGVWKWCSDHALMKKEIVKEVDPKLDVLIVQMDGDVSRKEKISHCWCDTNDCVFKMKRNPLHCDSKEQIRQECPLILPCGDHEEGINGYVMHMKKMIETILEDVEDTCIVIPCDSTEAWIVAAYDGMSNAEEIENPWDNIIAKGKYYHDIRIHGKKKHKRVYEQMVDVVCENWETVKKLCVSARIFENDILKMI